MKRGLDFETRQAWVQIPSYHLLAVCENQPPQTSGCFWVRISTQLWSSDQFQTDISTQTSCLPPKAEWLAHIPSPATSIYLKIRWALWSADPVSKGLPPLLRRRSLRWELQMTSIKSCLELLESWEIPRPFEAEPGAWVSEVLAGSPWSLTEDWQTEASSRCSAKG